MAKSTMRVKATQATDVVRFVSRRAGSHRELCIFINDTDFIELLRDHELAHAAREGHPEIAGAYDWLPLSPETPGTREHFFGRPASPAYNYDDKIALLECDCGSPGCWPLLCRIVVDDDRVLWTDFEQPHRSPDHASGGWTYHDFGPFVFARADYERALSELSGSRG
jgi:hypothetical protein